MKVPELSGELDRHNASTGTSPPVTAPVVAVDAVLSGAGNNGNNGRNGATTLAPVPREPNVRAGEAPIEAEIVPIRNPEARRAYFRDYMRLKRAGSCQTPGTTPIPVEFRVSTARDVLGLLEAQAQAVLADEEVSVQERARTIGYLAGVMLRAIETGDLAARTEALEMALRSRPKPEAAAR